jgi:hypothetical protein
MCCVHLRTFGAERLDRLPPGRAGGAKSSRALSRGLPRLAMRCSSQRFRQVARCVCRSLQNLACIQTRPSRTTTARAWRRPVVTESGCASQAIGMTEFCVAPCPVPQVREAVLRIATSSPCRIASECSHRERRPRLCRLTIPRSNVTSARGAHLRERSAERDGGNGGGASRAVFVQLGDQRGTPVAPFATHVGRGQPVLTERGPPVQGPRRWPRHS